VVDDGTAEVRENGIRVAELGRGDFFGELGLLVTGRRTATVVPTSPMTLLALFDQDFRRLEHELPDFARRLREACGERFCADRSRGGDDEFGPELCRGIILLIQHASR
jgi:monovalent cation:H+ antiporter, CPA1 family